MRIYNPDNETREKAVLDYRFVLPLALNDANDVRRALAIGDGVLPELPPGVKGDSQDCVLARALSNGWAATVGQRHAFLFHPKDGSKTQAEINKSVAALVQMGFEDVHEHGDDQGWHIEIPHTWAMKRFVSLFDDGLFPDLVLNTNEG